MERKTDAQLFFSEGDCVAPLGLIPLEGARELGEKINAHLARWAKEAGREQDNFIIESECPRFASGDGKGLIKSTVHKNGMSPDDNYQDLKRLIQAASGKG